MTNATDCKAHSIEVMHYKAVKIQEKQENSLNKKWTVNVGCKGNFMKFLGKS